MALSSTGPGVPALDQHEQPFVDYVRSLSDREMATYHATGHKLGVAATPEIVDLLGAKVFASDIWLTASAHHDPLHEAEALAAAAWGSDRSFYLVDGSSSGNHALFLASLRPGDNVIVSRDLHRSMLVALIMTGAQPRYVVPRMHPEVGISLGIAPEDIARALEMHPDAKLVAIVSPSFCGVASDLKGIVDVAHALDVPVYVDEAWGAHFHFHPDLPASAMESGADAAVSSVHKMLPALAQGAVLHMAGTLLDEHRVTQAVHMTQTTTPLFPIVASLDAARHQMATQGEALLRRTVDLSLGARWRLSQIPGLDVIDAHRLGVGNKFHDPTRLVIDVQEWGVTGFEVERMLNDQFEVAVEMSDQRGIIAIFNTGDTVEDIDRLVAAFSALAEEIPTGRTRSFPIRSSGMIIDSAPQIMSPRDAFFAESEEIALVDAVGRVTADLVTPCPPGIPILVPGEMITLQNANYLLELERIGRGAYGALAHRAGMVRVIRDHSSR